MGIHVLIIDPDTRTRNKLIQKLSRNSLIGNILESDNGSSALEKIRSKGIDMAFTEIDLPDVYGIDLINRMISECPNVSVLVHTRRENTRLVDRAIRNGAVGYLLKDSVDLEISNALSDIISGKIYICARMAREMITASLSKSKMNDITDKTTFTKRELDVISGIMDEKTIKEIAGILNISIETVRTHLRNVRKKIGAHNASGIVKYILENQLYVP